MAKHEINPFRNILKDINFKKSQLRTQAKAVQADCSHTHKGKKNGKPTLKIWDKDNGIYRCSECRAKLDLGELAKVIDGNKQDKRKAMKKYVKTSFKRVNNLLQITKININSGDSRDKKVYDRIAKQLKGNYMLEKLLIALYADNFKVLSNHGGKRNKGKKKKTTLHYGTRGMF